MRGALLLLLGLVMGYSVGRWVDDENAVHYYVTTQEVALKRYPSGVIGILPEGTLVESREKLAQTNDLASMACLRLVFGTTVSDTEELLREVDGTQPRTPKIRASTLEDAGLRAGARFDIESPSAMQPPGNE
jgi:hypothetical protein